MDTALAPAPVSASLGTVDASLGTLDGSLGTLDELMARVGVDGLVAARRSTSLGRRLETHTAAIRTTLDEIGLPVTEDSLAGYAELLLVAAQRCGRLLPTDPGKVDWTRADWWLLRLVAVCSLAVFE